MVDITTVLVLINLIITVGIGLYLMPYRKG